MRLKEVVEGLKIHQKSAVKPAILCMGTKVAEEQLPLVQFIRIHQFCIISVAAITPV